MEGGLEGDRIWTCFSERRLARFSKLLTTFASGTSIRNNIDDYAVCTLAQRPRGDVVPWE